MPTYNTMLEAYNNTMKNCRYYEETNNNAALLNEIGVLRGIFYCMELADIRGLNTLVKDFNYYIDKQQELKAKRVIG